MAEPLALTDSMAKPLSPVASQERYVLMDILRGFALFGVLAANMRGFNLPLSVYGSPEKFFPGRLDIAAQFLLNWFISGKAYALFAFLFGLGFAVQMTRAQSRSTRFPWFYLRRIAALTLIGILHGLLIWNGDILVSYALAAFLLFWFRNARLRTVSRWIVGIWGTMLLLMSTLFVVIHTRLADRFHGHIGLGGGAAPNDPQQVISLYRHARLAGVVRETALLWTGGHPMSHAHKFAWLQGTLLEDVPLALFSFTIFLLGLWVWRKGILQDLAAWRPALRRICRWTLPVGLLVQLLLEVAKRHPRYNNTPGIDFALSLFGLVGIPLLSCGYATLLALVSTSRHSAKIAWLAPVGRMALTNYLTQSIVCVAFYSGVVTGLYGRVGPAWDMVATLVLYCAQVALSHWWLARYRFGPAEWLWRLLTYGKRPPMRFAH